MDQWIIFEIAGSKKKNILNILVIIGNFFWLHLSHEISNQQNIEKWFHHHLRFTRKKSLETLPTVEEKSKILVAKITRGL